MTKSGNLHRFDDSSYEQYCVRPIIMNSEEEGDGLQQRGCGPLAGGGPTNVTAARFGAFFVDFQKSFVYDFFNEQERRNAREIGYVGV